MAKKNPYETEQAVLDLDSALLESASEKELKETIEKLKETYSQKRKDRIDMMKEFIIAYKNARQESVRLYAEVKAGKVSPTDAVEKLREFVASDKLTLDDEETETEEKEN